MAKKETEQELIKRLTAIKEENEKEGFKEIEAILKKRNLTITTNVSVHLNGQPIQIVIKSL